MNGIIRAMTVLALLSSAVGRAYAFDSTPTEGIEGSLESWLAAPPARPSRTPSPRPSQPPSRPQQPPSRPSQPPSRPQQPPPRPPQPPSRPQQPAPKPQPPSKPSQPPTQPGRPSQPPPQPRRPGQQQPQQPSQPSAPPAAKPPVIVAPPKPGQSSPQPQPGQGGRVLPKPQPIGNRSALQAIQRDTPKAMPAPAGAPSNSKQSAAAPQQTTVVNKTINNTTVVNNVTNVYNRTEVTPGGYWWHEYDGMRYCHYYDSWGYHWYGFYVGPDYYWARYYYDTWWWYDPGYGRWVYWRDGLWWWQDPYDAQVVYVYRDRYYYRYEDSRGGVVLQPKPERGQPAQEEKVFYSADGTRSVQLVGDRRDAYLYDLTIQDQADPKARPTYLGFGVKRVDFVSEEKRGSDGSPRQALKQINLAFDDATSAAAVDPNGARKVQTYGKDAYLYDLTSRDAAAKFLAGGVSGVKLETEERSLPGGGVSETLKYIALSVRDGGGNESLALFDPDGNALGQGMRAQSLKRPAVLDAGFAAENLGRMFDWR